jgi:hypothetical protein
MTAKELWEAIKWSNKNPDGSIAISVERVQNIDKAVEGN